MRHHLLKADNGKTIDVAVGDTFTIDLPGNPTTGYVWVREGITAEDQSDAKFSVKRKFKKNTAPKGTVGVGGTERFHVTARAQGVHEFVLVYKRRWANADSSDEKYTINVRVKCKLPRTTSEWEKQFQDDLQLTSNEWQSEVKDIHRA